jgi:hypothetical protein
MGQLVFQATAGGQTALVGPNPSSNFSLNVPAVNGTLVTTGDTGTVTNTMLASNVYTAPGAIGSGTPNTGAFTTLSASTSITNSSLTSGRVTYAGTGGLLQDSANLTVGGSGQLVINAASGQGTPLYLSSTDASANTQVIFAGNRTYQVGTGNSGSGFSNSLYFYDGTAGAERMRIDSSGNLLVGTTTPNFTALSGFVVNGPASGTTISVGHVTGTASGAGYAIFSYNGSNIGSITQNGTTTVLYNVSSDYRLKNDVTPITNALATVEALNPVSFTWVDGRKDDGFLAHELQSVIPNCITGEKDAINEDGTPQYQQMDSSGVIPFLVKAIQELNAKVTALEAQLGAK